MQRGAHLMPKQGTAAPWQMNMNYLKDRVQLGQASVEDRFICFSGAAGSAARL